MNLSELMNYTGQVLELARFRDYCPNGLQVEGRPEVSHIVSGVSASIALLQAAADAGADLVLVHHGWFWKNDDARIVGLKRARLKFLLDRDISLAAYHLPLDAHPELGNNAQLARLLGLSIEGWFGEQGLGAYGSLPQAMRLDALGGLVEGALQRAPLLIGDESRMIRRIAWCSGAAQQAFHEAIDLGVDAYLSGEISEQTVHLARESGVAYIAAGHHATERYGVQALGAHLAQRFGLDHHFIDLHNPV